jgi:hypothetical protein
MNFGEIFHVMRRRWYVAIPALLLTLVATAGMYVGWPTTYKSEVQLSLLASRSVAQAQGDAGNPYLAFTPGLDSVVDILARNLSSDQSAAQLQALGVTYPYTAGIAANAQGPFLAIDVTGKNRAGITQSMPILVAFAQRRLAEMQNASSAPKDTLVQAVLIAPPSAPTPVTKTKIELVAAVAVLGLVCSFLLCFIAENMLNRRRLAKYGSPDDLARNGQGGRPGYRARATAAQDTYTARNRYKAQPDDRPPESSEPVWTR